jgi:membrane protease YdiL (CAAX protease family)
MLYLATGSLIAPALAHGTYNLIALGYLRRRSGRERALSFLDYDNGSREMAEARLRR